MKNKKIVFTDAWKVELDVEDVYEVSLKEDEILVKNQYSLISAGTELACLAGKESSWFKFPSTPGYCSSGIVIECGSNVLDFKTNDRVFYYGNHSLYSKLNVKSDFCVKLIDGLDSKHAPFARTATIAMTALRTSDIELGDNVAVTGLGVVGNMAAQLSQLQGGKVIGIDLDAERLKKAEECGIKLTTVFDKGTLCGQLDEITSGGGIQTLIEATGITSVANDFLPYMGRFGEVIFLGTPRDVYTADLTDTFRQVHLADRALKFKSAHEWIYPVKKDPFIKHCFERNTLICFELIRDGRLNIDPLLSHIIQPEDAVQAYDGLRTRKSEYIGVIIDWTLS